MSGKSAIEWTEYTQKAARRLLDGVAHNAMPGVSS